MLSANRTPLCTLRVVMGLLTAIAFLLDVVTPLGVTAYVAYILRIDTLMSKSV
jgi:hypothetical protein